MPDTRTVPTALLLVTLALPSLAPCPLQGQPPPAEVPDVREAERELERAIGELEEIAGRRALRQEPPPLPELPPLDLSPEETVRIARLDEADLAGWTPEEREALATCLARNADALAALGARGEVPDGLLDGGRMLHLLGTARLRAVGDRLAYLEGREGEMLSGLETRLDLARRLALQPGAFGSIIGEAVYLAALPDVRRVATRPETSRATLEHLDALLGQRQADVPDPAAILAREALGWVDAERRPVEVDDGALAGDDPYEALFTAPLARDAADLARRCRELGCREAVAALERRDPDDPYGVIANMFLPNFLDMLKRLEGSAELTRLARTAVVLRLEALETGAYPEELTGVALDLGLSPEEAAEMVYERLAEGPGGAGARLRMASERVVADAQEQRREAIRPLLTWDLPPVEPPPDRP
jgi:hypothetical protein